MPDDDLEKILQELKNDESITTLNQPQTAERLDITDDNVNDFVMQRVGRLIESGIDIVESIQQTIASGFQPEELDAFSTLLTSVTNAAEVLNKINIQNKKAKATKEIKQMDITAKKQLPGGGNTTNNVLIATREEIIERFLEKNKDVIDASTITESDVEDDE